MYIAHNPISFHTCVFLVFFRSSPNHVPLKCRCPCYWCVGFSDIHLSLIGLIEDIKCSFPMWSNGSTSLNKSQYRLYLKHYSGFSWTSIFLFLLCPPYWYPGFFYRKSHMCFIPPNLVLINLCAMPCANFKVKLIFLVVPIVLTFMHFETIDALFCLLATLWGLLLHPPSYSHIFPHSLMVAM